MSLLLLTALSLPGILPPLINESLIFDESSVHLILSTLLVTPTASLYVVYMSFCEKTLVGTVGIFILTESPPVSKVHGAPVTFPVIVNCPVSVSAAKAPALINTADSTAAEIIERFIVSSLMN
ncbi:hypothetical protein D3C73_1170560 [compost metagenome]